MVTGCLDGVDSEPRLRAHGEEGSDGEAGDGWMIDECEMIDTPPPHFEVMSFMNCILVWWPFSFVWRAQGGGQGAGKEERNGKKKKKKKREKEYHPLKRRRRRREIETIGDKIQ